MANRTYRKAHEFNHESTKKRKHEKKKMFVFRAHAAQAPALRVLNFVFS
jgi:hypothetical protein